MAPRLLLPAILLAMPPAGLRAGDPADVDVRIDWPTVLSASAYRLGAPTSWERSAFTGNGRDGMMLTIDQQSGRMRIRLGRSDLIDHRTVADASQFRPLWEAGRLPVGTLQFDLGKPIEGKTSQDARIDLASAEASGVAATGDRSAAFRWRIWTPYGAAVNVIEIEGQAGALPTAVFVPEAPVIERGKGKPADYAPHPEPVASTQGEIRLLTQAYGKGGGYTVAWRPTTSGNRMTIVAAIGFDRTGDGHRTEALAALAAATDIEALRRAHQAWWTAWWQRSALDVPEADRTAFYYQQLYKLASAMRADGPMLDLMGPWYGGGPWPGIWWNLNVQLTYQLCAPANRLERLDNLVAFLERHADRIGQQVPASMGGPHALAIGRLSALDASFAIEADKPESGNLTWTLAVLWDGWRLSGDRARAQRLLPLMARAAAFHLARAKPGPDGKLHVPGATSPEAGTATDTNYELMAMRWLLRTLVAAETELGWKHPDQARWRAALAQMTPFPVDANGYMLGAGRAAPLDHRHWSHLIGIYPLRDFDPADPAELDLVKRSVAHWTSSRKEWRGYSAQGATSMWALLGEPERAFAAGGGKPIGGPNTLYREAGPCIETPLLAAATLQEMLLTWDRRGLRLFAGAPAAWPSASFHQLRAPTGLTVSAHRDGGATQWVRLSAAVAQTVTLEGRFATLPQARSAQPVAVKDLGDGWISLPLAAGQSVLLIAPGAQPMLTLPMVR